MIEISSEKPLELDYDYYKKVILEPLFRLLKDVDLDRVLIDRLR